MDCTEKQFLELMQQHKGVLLKISKMYRDDKDDQQDLQQEMLIQLWKAYPSFNGNSQFATWMYRVCLNVAITTYRRDKKKPIFESLQQRDFSQEDSNHEEKESQLSFFYAAVQELSEIEKALVFLFMEGQSHKEISANLGISEGNARIKLMRTKDKLQMIIKNNGYEF